MLVTEVRQEKDSGACIAVAQTRSNKVIISVSILASASFHNCNGSYLFVNVLKEKSL